MVQELLEGKINEVLVDIQYLCRMAFLRQAFSERGLSIGLAGTLARELSKARRLSPVELNTCLAKEFILSWPGGELAAWNGELCEHKNGAYVIMPPTEFTLNISRSLQESRMLRDSGKALTTSLIQSVKWIVLSQLPACHAEPPCWLKDGLSAKSTIVVKNGIIDLEQAAAGNLKLREHTYELFTLNSLPYEWDPQATAPNWLAFLDRVLEGDQERIQLLRLWFGYNLVPWTHFEKFMLFVGEGANGKSVALNVLQALLGEANVASVTLRGLSGRFDTFDLLGRLANIVSELEESRSRLAEGKLKAMVSGERVMVRRMHRNGFTTRLFARHTFATNALPNFQDGSEGLWRRMLIMPWRVVIPPHERDINLARRIIENEMPGVFRWALEGLQELVKRGGFPESKAMNEVITRYRLDTNPAQSFLREELDITARMVVQKGVLYARYKTYCGTRGVRPITDAEFGKEVKRAFPGILEHRPTVNGRRTRVWDFTPVVVSLGAKEGENI